MDAQQHAEAAIEGTCDKSLNTWMDFLQGLGRFVDFLSSVFGLDQLYVAGFRQDLSQNRPYRRCGKSDDDISRRVQFAGLSGKAQSYFTEVHEIMMEQAASEAAAMLMSFDRFTRLVLGLDGMTVLRAWTPPVADDVERLGIQNYQPDARRLEEWGHVWSRQWNRRMERN